MKHNETIPRSGVYLVPQVWETEDGQDPKNSLTPFAVASPKSSTMADAKPQPVSSIIQTKTASGPEKDNFNRAASAEG